MSLELTNDDQQEYLALKQYEEEGGNNTMLSAVCELALMWQSVLFVKAQIISYFLKINLRE